MADWNSNDNKHGGEGPISTQSFFELKEPAENANLNYNKSQVDYDQDTNNQGYYCKESISLHKSEKVHSLIYK